MFSLKKWAEKAVKAGIVAFLAAPVVATWLGTLGISVDQEKLYAGAIVAIAAVANFLKHQGWTPKLIKFLL